MTDKQKLQKDRAYFKYVLSGIPKPIKLESLREYERNRWNEIILIRNALLNELDWNSKKLGLNIPEFRCWCGKEGKYTPEYDISYTGCTKVCKKHIKNE